MRCASLLVALLSVLSACSAGLLPSDQAWTGSFVLDAEESSAMAQCDLRRTMHIDATMDCLPEADAIGKSFRSLRCKGQGSARYAYALALGGGAEVRNGSGSFTGVIDGSLRFGESEPGYEFVTYVPVAGTFEGTRGSSRSSGTESRTLEAYVFFKYSTFHAGDQRIAFDGDQEPSLEGPDCVQPTIKGRRRMTLNLAALPGVAKARDTTTVTIDPRNLTPLPTKAAVPSSRPTQIPGRTPIPTPGTTWSEIVVDSRPTELAVNDATGRVYVVNASNVAVIDARAGKALDAIRVPGEPRAIAVDPSTNRVLIANTTGGLTVVDGASNEALISVGGIVGPAGVALNRAASKIYVTNNQSRTVTVIDATSNTVRRTVRVGAAPVGVAVNDRTQRVYVANYGDGTIAAIDGATDGVLLTKQVGAAAGGTSHVAVDRVRDRVFVTDLTNRRLWMLDGATLDVLTATDLGAEVWAVAVSEDTGRVFVTGSQNGAVYVVDAVTGTLLTTVALGGGSYGIAVDDKSGRIFATRYGANSVAILR